MNKKEYCLNNKPVAEIFFSMCSGLLIHGIEYGINDSVFYSAYSGNTTTYHKARIYYTEKDSYFMYNGNRIHFSACMKYDF